MFILGNVPATAYGDLEGYCEHYVLAYAMMITALCGAGMVMIGFLQFSMSLSANRALLQKKYSRPMRKHREHVLANQSVNGDMKNLVPPASGPRIQSQGPYSVGGVHAPSGVAPSHHNYNEPPGYNDTRFVSYFAKSSG